MTDIQNKKVWITGASSGIGEALSYAFAQEGAELILSSRKLADLEKVKANCTGAKAVHLEPLDVAKHEEVFNCAKRVITKIGTIDILVNNAGISQRSLTEETDFAVDKRIMDVNFFGSIALTKALLPAMLNQRSGQFIVISSLIGKFGSPLRSTYAASKHALHGFFDSLRSEVYDRGLRVLLVCPGFIRTNVSINALTADGSKQNKMDEGQKNGMDPSELAQKIIQGMKSGKEEINVGGKEIMGIHLKRFAPSWFSRYMRKAKVT